MGGDVDVSEPMIEWIRSRIKATTFSIDLWTEHHSKCISEFITDPSIISLFATVDQDLKQLIICSASPPAPTDSRVDVTYFIRAQGQILTPSTIDRTIIHGTTAMQQSASSVLTIVEEELYTKIIHSRQWNESSKQELLGLYHRFMASLTESANEESGRTFLYLPFKGDLKALSEISHGDKSCIQQLEAIAIHWIRQTKEVLNSHTRNALDHQGPIEELKFWEWRMEDLSGLSHQLNCLEIRSILAILKEANSKYARPVENLTSALNQGGKEAENSVKFLKLLWDPCKLLSSLRPAEIPSIMHKFLNCVRLIHFHSENYKTLERISDLIRRVSSEIIRHCSSQISLDDVFYGDVERSIATLNDCINCGNKWKELYNRTTITVNKGKIAASEGDGHEGEEHWKLNDASIFAEMDAFVQRCDDLIDICNGRIQFIQLLGDVVDNSKSATRPIFGWTNGPEIGSSIKAIQEAFLVQIDRLRGLDYSILNARESRWHGDYNLFKLAIKDLDTMLVNTINGALEPIEVIDAAAHLVQLVCNLAHRPTIKNCAEKRCLKLRDLYLQQCNRLRHEFDDCHRLPPLAMNHPRFSGSALWVKALCSFVKRGWYSVCSSTGANIDINSKGAYTDLNGALQAFQHKKYKDWSGVLLDPDHSHLQDRLYEPILRKTTEIRSDLFSPLLSTFDHDIMAILTEAYFWNRLHNEDFVTPSEVLGIYHQREILRIIRDRVMGLVSAHTTFVKHLKGTSMLYLDHLKKLDKKLRPGLKKITWSIRPIVIEKFIQATLLMVNEYQKEVVQFHTGMDQIEIECNKMASTSLIHINRNTPYEGKHFESIQADMRSKGKNTIVECHTHIARQVDIIFEQFQHSSGDVQHEWASHLKKVDIMILKSLKKCILSSLQSFSQILDENNAEVQPIYTTNAKLLNGKIETRPSLIAITNSVNIVAKETVCVAKVLTNISDKWNGSFRGLSYFDILSEDENILNSIVHIMNKVAICTRDVHNRLVEWEKYRTLWTMDKQSFLRRYSNKSTGQTYEDDIENFKNQQASVQAERVSNSINFIQIHYSALRSELCKHSLDFQNGLLAILKETTSSKIDSWENFINTSICSLNEPIDSISDLRGKIDCMKAVEERYNKFENDFEPLVKSKHTIEKYDTENNSEECNKISRTLCNLKVNIGTLFECIEVTTQVIKVAEVKMKNDFLHLVQNHNETKSQFCRRVQHEIHKGNTSSFEEASELVHILQKNIIARKEAGKTLLEGLELFKLDLVNVKALSTADSFVGQMNETLTLFQKWNDLQKGWLNAVLLELNCDEITDGMENVMKELLSINNNIRSWSFWTTLRDSVNKFKEESIPLLLALINTDLRDRHWKAMEAITSDNDIQVHCKDFTLQRAFNLGFHNYKSVIIDISTSASRELAVEHALDDIENKLSDFVIDFDHQEGIIKMCPKDDLFLMLEDANVMVASMKASSSCQHFIPRVAQLETALLKASNFFETFLPLQQQWLYLHNIFVGSSDIATQLPQVCNQFMSIHKQFRNMTSIMNQEKKLRQILGNHQICSSSLTKIQSEMEGVQSSLNAYLESKRMSFPRFYFISDDDLLEMIGHASHPNHIQKYIKKCFEGIHTLLLERNENQKCTITGGKAKDEETLIFANPITVEGSIDKWMNSVLFEMNSCLKNMLHECYVDLKTTKQNKWVPKWQGQLLITSGTLAWTNRCERALDLMSKRNEKNSLRSVRKRQITFLRRLTEMVQSINIDSTNRTKIVALITTELHNRDVIERVLHSGCQDTKEFVWSSQLRFYLDSGGGCISKQNNHSIPFGYEYQGNNGRLVITPLTDRCVMTLLTAFSLYRGGNPLGPAGTGKTETVKDLAKSLGFFCVVTNCSENMDYKSLGKIFSGLCQSGSWGCFDEFNRIKIEVMSAAAMQIASILNAQRCELKSFLLMGIKVACSPLTGIFITMNPGYTGRTELPDNLKTNLRPVAMMEPDLVLITEVTLAAEGFTNGRGLAKKIIYLYQLMKQQLSKQSHYDFGLRSIKSVLSMAGSIKQKEPTSKELAIVIKALIGLNTPRFLPDDRELFQLLLIDLFPDQNLDIPLNSALASAVHEVLLSKGLNAEKSVIDKTIQLANSQLTRHSNILIGKTMTGKSTIWQSLADAKTMLNPMHEHFSASLKTHTLNPKALNISELYGSYDMTTCEWSDGVLSRIFKLCAERNEAQGEDWIVMDGPIDTLWIESMNSVMDDSKLLTLINGDRISMSDNMSLIFEVEDLSVASPATISRAGMIYVDCNFMWKPFVDTWIHSHENIVESQSRNILELVRKYINPLLVFKRDCCFEPIPLDDIKALSSFTKFFDLLLPKAFNKELKMSLKIIERWFIFCLIWTIGAAVDDSSRTLLDEQLRNLAPNVMPSRCVYEYFVDSNTNDFQLWSEMLLSSQTLSTCKSTSIDTCCEIYVPTLNTIRNSFVLSTYFNGNQRVLITGAHGTGKTSIASKLLNEQKSDQTHHLTINLSRTTTSNILQSYIEGSLEKRSKGVLGPLYGANKLIIFIDDLNITRKTSEESPFQPPLELLRQFIDYGGWYHRSRCSWQKVAGAHLVCAMTHSTGGREIISSRTKSRFSLLNCTEYGMKDTILMFSSILDSKLSLFPSEIKACFNIASRATVGLYNKMRTTFRPIVGKGHYIFNLRDVLRVAHGMCLSLRTNKIYQTEGEIIDLWTHECMRTFSDRLVHDQSEDGERFWNILTEQKHAFFSASDVHVLAKAADLNPPLFSHLSLSKNKKYETFSDDLLRYQKVIQISMLQQYLSKCLEEYNGSGEFISMNLILFHDAINHICRVQRILLIERGHMLFVGVGGSGRESITRLAAFITGCKFMCIGATPKYRRSEFRDALKLICMKCGIDNKKVVLFLRDADIKEEIFFEDVSNLMLSGTVADVFSKDEITTVCDEIRNDAIAAKNVHETEDALWNFFCKRIQDNLHIIMALNATGNSLSSRLHSFPALMNHASINWLKPWTRHALEQIASKQIMDSVEKVPEFEVPDNKLHTCLCEIHLSSIKKSDEMNSCLMTHNYVTPMNYLEFLKIFKTLYYVKDEELRTQIEKLSRGLYKLQAGQNQVATMRIDLEKKQQIVKESQCSCENMLEEIMANKKHTEQQKKSIEMESEKILEEENQLSKIAMEAEADLAVALPALQSALDQVEKLDKSSVTELKAYANPPIAVEQVLSCVMILLGKPTGWADAKKVMGNTNFLSNLRSYDTDNIKGNILAKVDKLVSLPSFASVEIANVSKAAGALCAWCHAIHLYAGVTKEVTPKRAKLRAAEFSLFEKQNDLKGAKDALMTATSKLVNLKNGYDKSVNEKDELKQEAIDLKNKLQRAETLVNSLSLEYDRWKSSIENMKVKKKSLLGDVLISSALLAYGGPFDTRFRSMLLSEWVSMINNNQILTSPEFSLNLFLGIEEDIQKWNFQGLPKDSFSTENALIIKHSSRWPLIIDPQGQANRWIKAMHGESLKVLDPKKKEFFREIEIAISFGLPVLIHNAMENLDSNLDPVLSRSLIKRGSCRFLRFGDKEIEYNEKFQLFITTKIPSPHYSPEVLAKISLVNFAVTKLGLEEQLLASLIVEEAPTLETRKSEVMLKLSDGRKKLLTLEDDILRLLVECSGNLIEDLTLINALEESKNTADNINAQYVIVEETAKTIDIARNVYRNAATRASTIFFSLTDLRLVDPMYQFSLDTYVSDFKINIEKSRVIKQKNEGGVTRGDRVKIIADYHTFEIFKSTCIALFEKDKLLFALQLCCSIMLEQTLITDKQLDFICHGTIASSIKPNTEVHNFSWMKEHTQKSLMDLQLVITGEDITDVILKDEDEWERWYSSEKPELEDLPGAFSSQLSNIEKFIILRGLRLDRMIHGATQLIKTELGIEFTKSYSFDLVKAHEQSSPSRPLLVILSPGVDPVSQISHIAETCSQSLVQVALGQGQGAFAINAIKKASQIGGWIFLANCHLMPQWLSTNLEPLLESLQDKEVHNDFRLWLSSKPTSDFPLTMLQQSVKVTTELPKGLSSNLLQIFKNLSPDDANENGSKCGAYERLLFCLSWAHCILLERRKFQSQGFNVQYDFNESDFKICNDILSLFLSNYEENKKIPYEALQYLIGEANYGGKVTDKWDRRLLNVYIKSLFCKEAVEHEKFALSGTPGYFIPDVSSKNMLSSYITYAESLSSIEGDPSVVGQHSNAQIASQIEDARRLLYYMSVLCHDKQMIKTSNISFNDDSNTTRKYMIKRLKLIPSHFNQKKILQYKTNTLDHTAMQVFLQKEINQYSELLLIIHKTHDDLVSAFDGKIQMNETLESILLSLLNFKVPKQWKQYYNSCKGLDSWIEDLCKRIQQLNSWVENRNAPSIFWLGGFTNPSGFLTTIMQIEARKKGLPIDTFVWDFEIIDTPVNHLKSIGTIPECGVYISGLLLEGASYNISTDCLSDPFPMELVFKMPVIHFHPTELGKNPTNKQKYVCPMYSCPDRAGSNQSAPSYVFPIHFNTGRKSSDHWVKRGVAVLLSNAD